MDTEMVIVLWLRRFEFDRNSVLANGLRIIVIL